MKDTALKVGAVIFLAVSLAHLARLVFRVDLVAGGVLMPMWLSIVGFLGPLFLSLWFFRAAKK
jgi:Na+/proline symporter